jgi:flagellar basal-body rod protein FlgC
MGFLSSMNISGSALSATRMRMDVIAENMANINTTRTETGEPFRRRFVVFQEMSGNSTFAAHDRRAGTPFSQFFNRAQAPVNGGVRVLSIEQDTRDFLLDFNPSHPDADEDGYVRLPNIDVVQEMVDMMSAFRAYEANITALNTFKDMATRTLEIGR